MSIIAYLKKLWFAFPNENEHPEFWLALGGWAARGIAHVGVLKYLEENDLQPKEVSGTSMGSIIAAFIATGKTSTQIIEYLKNIKFITLIDPSLQSGLIKWEKIKQLFEEIFWDTYIEDTKIPLRIVATDIDSWKKKVFTTWKIVDALRASIGIPGVFDPYVIEGCRYVDGWLTENIPCSVLSTENIVAVSALRDINRNVIKKSKILGFEFDNHFATGYAIMQKSIDILLAQNEEKSIQSSKQHVILLRPKFPKIDYYEFHRYEEIIEIWYQEAKKILSEKITRN